MYQNWIVFLILLFFAILITVTRKNGIEKNALGFTFLIFFLVYFLILVILSTLYYGDLFDYTLSNSSCPQNCN